MVQAIGRHRVACNSIEDAPHSALLEGQQAAVLYTDPPWSNRMMSYFDTLQYKQTNEGGDGNISAERMLDILADVIDNHVDGHVFVLWSIKNRMAQERLSDSLAWMDEQYPRYTDGDGTERKYVMIHGATHSRYSFNANISGMSGLDVTRTVFDAVGQPGQFAYDPMCGQGNTAVGAVEHGMRFAGNELNRKRVNDAVGRIKAAENRWSNET